MSKAVVLQKSTDYIQVANSAMCSKRVTEYICFQYLRQQKKKQEADLNTLRKEVKSDLVSSLLHFAFDLI